MNLAVNPRTVLAGFAVAGAFFTSGLLLGKNVSRPARTSPTTEPLSVQMVGKPCRLDQVNRTWTLPNSPKLVCNSNGAGYYWLLAPTGG
jgi:hypothetical protein